MSRPAAPATPPLPLMVVAGLFLASLALRPQLLAIGPLLPLIRDDLGLSATVGGLLTSIPVLCMGLGAPVGPLLAARLGPRTAFALCMALIIGSRAARSFAPDPLLVLFATFGIGIGTGFAGAVPSMIVSARLPGRPAVGTGAPFALGVARDMTGDFTASLWLLVGVAASLLVCVGFLPSARLRPGIGRSAVAA